MLFFLLYPLLRCKQCASKQMDMPKAKYFVFFVKKKRETFSSFSLRTQSRDRTGMEVNPLVFETSASTNSAIWACSFHNAYVVF